MGAIEIQVFVSLVVILGAAFVALICDFLKGSNEQLREANIVMRVREDERDKRDDLVEKVQQQTIEVVAKVQGALVGRPAAAPVPVAQAARVQQPPAAAPAPLPTPVTDARELFERAQSERSARGRRGGRRSEERSAPPPREESVASWAQDIVIRKHQEAEPAKPAAVEPVRPVEAAPVVQAAPAFEVAAAAEAAPAAAAQVSVTPAPMPLAAQVAQSKTHEFAAQPDQTGIPSVAPVLAQARVPMALAQPIEQAPVAAPVAQAVPAISQLESPDAREMFGSQAKSKQEAQSAPALVDAQQPLTAAPLSIPVTAFAGSLQPAEVAGVSALPLAQQPAAVYQLSHASGLSLATSGPAALAGRIASVAPDALVPEAESALPALQLHTEVPEFEIVPPSIQQIAQTVEPLATSEVPSAESRPLMVVAAEEMPLETVTFESPVAESTVEVTEVAESPVLEPVEAVVPEMVAAATIEEVPVPAEVVESPVLEQVEALVPETVFAAVVEESAFTADYSLIEDTPVYAEIPTLPRVEPELAPAVQAAAEPEPAAIFEPTMFESGADEEIQVVRIRVLSDDDVMPVSEFSDTLASLDDLNSPACAQPAAEPEPVVAPMAAELQPELSAVTEPAPELTAAVWSEPVADREPVAAEMTAAAWPEPVAEPEPVVAELTAPSWIVPSAETEPVSTVRMAESSENVEAPYEPSIWLTGAEPSTWSLEPDSAKPQPAFTEASVTETEPMFAEAASFSQAASDDPFSYKPAIPDPVAQAPAPVIPQVELRPKVVEMRSAAQARADQEPPAVPTLVLPGGFHEPTALARLLEDEAPFTGLVIAVSVVDRLGVRMEGSGQSRRSMKGSGTLRTMKR